MTPEMKIKGHLYMLHVVMVTWSRTWLLRIGATMLPLERKLKRGLDIVRVIRERWSGQWRL